MATAGGDSRYPPTRHAGYCKDLPNGFIEFKMVTGHYADLSGLSEEQETLDNHDITTWIGGGMAVPIINTGFSTRHDEPVLY